MLLHKSIHTLVKGTINRLLTRSISQYKPGIASFPSSSLTSALQKTQRLHLVQNYGRTQSTIQRSMNLSQNGVSLAPVHFLRNYSVSKTNNTPVAHTPMKSFTKPHQTSQQRSQVQSRNPLTSRSFSTEADKPQSKDKSDPMSQLLKLVYGDKSGSGGDSDIGMWGKGFLIALGVGIFFYFGNPITVVPAGHIGVVDLFGNVREHTLQPGIHLVNPLAHVTHQ